MARYLVLLDSSTRSLQYCQCPPRSNAWFDSSGSWSQFVLILEYIVTMKYTVIASLIASAAAFAPAQQSAKTSALSETKADLEALAAKCNPVIKYFDPLNIGDGDEATIAWYRHSEIKHGRIAMAAFVGYIVQSNFVFPWAQTMAGDPHPSVSLTPEAQWDAIPLAAKVQIITFIAFLEFFDENGGGGALPHYTQGRKPGQYPEFKDNFPLHPVLNLYDPFGFRKNLSAEKKERGLVAEVSKDNWIGWR